MKRFISSVVVALLLIIAPLNLAQASPVHDGAHVTTVLQAAAVADQEVAQLAVKATFFDGAQLFTGRNLTGSSTKLTWNNLGRCDRTGYSRNIVGGMYEGGWDLKTVSVYFSGQNGCNAATIYYKSGFVLYVGVNGGNWVNTEIENRGPISRIVVRLA